MRLLCPAVLLKGALVTLETPGANRWSVVRSGLSRVPPAGRRKEEEQLPFVQIAS